MARSSGAKKAAGRPRARRVPIAELREKDLEYLRGDREALVDSIRLERQIFRALEEDLGLLYVDELEAPDIGHRFDEASSSRNPRTRLGRLGRLKGILGRGLRWGMLHSRPPIVLRDIVKADEFPEAKRKPPPSPIDVDRYLKHLENDVSWEGRRLHALIATIARAGLALSQALRLRVADIDLAGGAIWLPGSRAKIGRRGSEAIAVRIDDELKGILSGWTRRTKCEWAFPGVRRRGPWKKRDVLAQIKTSARAAGITRINVESLRRHFDEQAVTAIPGGSAPRFLRPESAGSDTGFIPSVEIGLAGEPAYIRGKRKRRLTPMQHKVIAALLEAKSEGLSKKAMTQNYGGKEAWRQILIRLRKDPDWASAIAFPGLGFPGKDSDFYRILPW